MCERPSAELETAVSPLATRPEVALEKRSGMDLGHPCQAVDYFAGEPWMRRLVFPFRRTRVGSP